MAIQVTVISLDFESDCAPKTSVHEKDEITVGASPECDVVLTGLAISGIHLSINVQQNSEGPFLCVTDLGSESGSAVDAAKLIPHLPVKVESNKRISIGEYLIKPVFKAAVAQSQPATKKEERPRAHTGRIVSPARRAKEEAPEKTSEKAATTPAPRPVVVASTRERKPSNRGSIPAPRLVKNSAPQRESELAESTPTAAAPSLQISGAITSGQSHRIDFTARKLYVLSGKVLHHGAPLAGVAIDAGSLGSAVTGEDGEFRIHGVPEQTSYVLKAHKDRFQFQSSHASGVIAEGATVEFSATQLCDLRGVISHNGVPLAGVVVDGGVLGKTRTNEQGEYCFPEIPEGTQYVLQPLLEGYIFEAQASAAGQSTDKKIDRVAS